MKEKHWIVTYETHQGYNRQYGIVGTPFDTEDGAKYAVEALIKEVGEEEYANINCRIKYKIVEIPDPFAPVELFKFEY